MKYDIREVVNYQVEADSPNEAMRAFLADPSKFLKDVDEREVWERSENGQSRYVEWDEYREAEGYAVDDELRERFGMSPP